MTRETIWNAGQLLVGRLAKDHTLMVRSVLVYVQNDNGYGTNKDQKILDGNSALEYLTQMQTQLNAEIDALRKTIEQFRDSP